jgi:hypothetical protein
VPSCFEDQMSGKKFEKNPEAKPNLLQGKRLIIHRLKILTKIKCHTICLNFAKKSQRKKQLHQFQQQSIMLFDGFKTGKRESSTKHTKINRFCGQQEKTEQSQNKNPSLKFILHGHIMRE